VHLGTNKENTMTYYAALDVSLRSVAVCIIDDEGNYHLETKVPSEVEDIVQCLEGFEGEIELVGFEAGMLTQYLSYGLTAAAFQAVCLETHHVKEALKAMRNKTDKNDARGIAQLLRTGWYRAVHVKSVESHEVRALLSSRRVILRKCVDLENELRGLLRIFGTKLPSRLDHGSFEEMVRAPIEADPALRRALLPMLELRGMLYQAFVKLDTQVTAMSREDTVCQRLMTVPGVGPVTALTFKAGVDDPTRFKNSRLVAAHFGLTPKREQSGEMAYDGRISRKGDVEVRCALYLAAHALLTRNKEWSPLKAWGVKLRKIKGHRKATIAVARKLAVILHRMWIDETDFRWHSEDRAA
jgi:transposase